MSYLDDIFPQPHPVTGAEMTWREALRGMVDELGYNEHFNTRVVAQSWKTMENAQTRLLNAFQDGYIGKHPDVQEHIMSNALHRMRTAMRDQKKWVFSQNKKMILIL